MTNQKEKEKLKEVDFLKWKINCLYGIVIFLIILFLIFMIHTNNTIDKLPHKYCHNETERIEVNCQDFISIHVYEWVKPEFYSNIIAENVTYKNISKEEAEGILKFLNNIQAEHCYKEEVKEVCEIR